MENTRKKLQTIFAAVLGIPAELITDGLSPQTNSTWDSLNAIILITEIEKEFGIKFSYEEAMAVKNFGDAVQLVQSKTPAV